MRYQVVSLVVLDFVVAVSDALYNVVFETTFIATILNTLFYGGMGMYYTKQGGNIARALEETAGAIGANSRVRQFSRNVRRTGQSLIMTFIMLLFTNVLLLILSGTGVLYYVIPTITLAMATFCLTLQSFFLVLSYKPAERPKSKEPVWSSSTDLTKMGAGLSVYVDRSGFSNDSPMSQRNSEMERESSRRSGGDPGKSPARSPSLKRGLPSSKSLKGLTGSKFNLFDDALGPSTPAVMEEPDAEAGTTTTEAAAPAGETVSEKI
jgi:hypothetical protein